MTVAWLSEILEIFYVCDEKAKGLDHVTQHEPGSWHWRDRKEDDRDVALYRPESPVHTGSTSLARALIT